MSHRPQTNISKGQGPQIEPFDMITGDHWNRLFRASNTINLFYDHTVLASAMSAWRDCRPNHVVCIRNADGEPVFLLPISFRTGALGRRLKILRVPTCDGVEPLTLANTMDVAVAEVFDFLEDTFRPHRIVVDSATEAFHAALAHHYGQDIIAIRARQKSAILHLPATMEEYMIGLSRNTRSQIRRKMKKAGHAGITFRVVERDRLPEGYDFVSALDQLTSLHRRRFDSIDKPSFFVQDEYQKFHRSLCADANRAALDVSFTEAVFEEQIIGSIYGIYTPKRYIYLMIGFDPEFSTFSLGNCLIYCTIEHLIERGIQAFDFKVGDEEYKKRWTSDTYSKIHLSIPLNTLGQAQLLKDRGARAARKLGRVASRIGKRITGFRRRQ